MAIVKPNSKVLVSGANGFIAVWVVHALLERGYSVRGTVRSEAKAAYLRDYFKSYGQKFEVVIVPDITKEGAFDEAVKGVDAIEHTASPVIFQFDDPEEYIVPAVHGTVGMLQSALKHGVKRVVVTSSSVAVGLNQSHVLTEKDWNKIAITEVNEKGKNAANELKYTASKTLAEQAAWKFVEDNNAQLGWDLTVLNPPYVFGPSIHEVTSPDALNTSNAYWYERVLGKTARTRDDLSSGAAWVDVRDIAKAHVLALEKEQAGGERFIISEGPFVWQDFVDLATALSPGVYPHKLRPGYPDIERTFTTNYNTAKAAKVLGIQYRTKDETTQDMLKDFARRGW